MTGECHVTPNRTPWNDHEAHCVVMGATNGPAFAHCTTESARGQGVLVTGFLTNDWLQGSGIGQSSRVLWGCRHRTTKPSPHHTAGSTVCFCDGPNSDLLLATRLQVGYGGDFYNTGMGQNQHLDSLLLCLLEPELISSRAPDTCGWAT